MFEAARHDGASIIEIMQNCIIFNDDAHNQITSRDMKDDNQLLLEHGKPMIFGKDRDKGIKLGRMGLEVVSIGKNGVTEKDLLVHDMHQKDPGIHLMLAKMKPPTFPMALGVIRAAKFPTYDDLVVEQIEYAKENSSIKCVDDLLNSGDTWEL